MEHKKLAIISTHPIQYNAPLFKLLTQRAFLKIKVLYTWGQSKKGEKYDPGFGKQVNWDIPLLEGYEYSFIKNTSRDPGTHHYTGIINPTLLKEIEEWQPTAVLVYGWSFKSHLQCLRYFHKKIPVIFRGDSNLLDEVKGIRRMVRRIFLNWIYSHVDHALYVGTQNKLYYKQHGLKESQLSFSPHAIDNDRFSREENKFITEAAHWRIQLQIAPDELVFLFAGKLEPKKDPELLIKAFTKIYEPGIHLVVVGNGILENELKMNYAGIPGLHFIDFQNQSIMPVVYHLGDVFVLPSKGPAETWGLSVNEAMACKKAIIVSNKVGCAVDLVENDKNGYIFESGNELELANKMKLFISDHQKSKQLGLASFDKISDWNYKFIAERIEKLLN